MVYAVSVLLLGSDVGKDLLRDTKLQFTGFSFSSPGFWASRQQRWPQPCNYNEVGVTPENLKGEPWRCSAKILPRDSIIP